MPSEKFFNRNSTDKPKPIGDPQWVLELKNKLLTNEILLLALQDAVESDLVKGEDTVCRWGSFFTRSDKSVMEKVANAAREYASEAARLGIVDAVEKSCDETKAGKGALKVHGKSHKVVVLGQTSCGEEVDSTEALLTAAETKQLTGLAAFTESNKLEYSIAFEKKRRSDPFVVFDDNSNEVEDPSEEYTAEALVEDGTDLMVDGDKRDSIAWWGIRTDPVSTTHLISELKRRKEVKRQAVEAKRIMEKELEVQKRLEEQQASRERSREIERAQDRERAAVRAAEELKQRSYAANPQHAQASSSSSSSSVGGRGRVSFPQCSIVTGPSPSPAYFPQPPPHPVTLTFPSQKSITIPPAFKAPPAFPQQQHHHQHQQQKEQQTQYEKHQNFSKVQVHSQSPHLSGTFPQRSIQRSSLDLNGDVISTSYPTPTLPSNDSAVAVGVISTSNHHHNNHHPVVFSFSSQATAAKTGRFSKPGTGISFGRRDGIGVGTSSSFSSSSSSSTAGYGASFPNRSTVITSPSTSISTPTSSSSHTGNAEKGMSPNAGMPFDTYTLNTSGSSSVSTVSKNVGSSYRQNNSNSVSHSIGVSINIASDAAMMKKNSGNKETSSDYKTKEKRNFHDINSHKSDTSYDNNNGDNYNQKQNQNHGNGRRSTNERYEGKSDALDREREGSSRLSGTLRGREDDGRMDKGRGKQENNNQDMHRGRDNEGVEFRKESKPNAFNISISSSSSNGNSYGNANANVNDSFHKRNNELHNSNKNVTESDSKFVSFPNKTGTYTPHQTHSNDNNSNSNNNNNNTNTNNDNNNNSSSSSSSNYINSNSSHHNNSHHYNTNDNKFRGDGSTINNFNNNSSNNDKISRNCAHHQIPYSSSIDNNHKNSSVNANDYKESTHTQKTFNSHPSSSDYRSKNGNINSNNNSDNSNNGNNQYDRNRNRNGDHEKGRSRSRSRSKGKGNGRGRSRGRSKERSRSRDRDRDRVRGHTQQNRV